MPSRSIPLAKLHPAPYNPRLTLQPGDPAWRRLERSIREFSLVQPIVWNERTGHVVAGHQRLEVIRHLGHTEVDCIVVDLPLEREKALNVTLNNPNVASDWDPELLTTLLDDLQSLPDFDATLTGFDETHLRELLLAPEPALPEPETLALENVRITFEIHPDRWPDFRPHLDTFLASHHIRPHIDLPVT